MTDFAWAIIVIATALIIVAAMCTFAIRIGHARACRPDCEHLGVGAEFDASYNPPPTE